MAQIVKINDEYFVEYWAQGLEFQKKGGPERAMAEALLQKIKQSVPENIEDIYRVRNDRVKDVIGAYATHLKQKVHPITRTRLLAVANEFLAYLQSQTDDLRLMQDVTPRVLQDYFKHCVANGERPKWITVRFYLLELFFDYAIGFGALNDNPLLHVSVVKKNPLRRPKTFLTEEIDAFVATENVNTQQALIVLVATTGLSYAQLLRIRLADFNLKERRLSFDGCHWPLDSRLVSWVINKSDNGCLFDRKDVVQFNTVYNQKILRNTFVSMILAKGASLLQVCEYLQEQDILNVLPYSHFIKSEPLS